QYHGFLFIFEGKSARKMKMTGYYQFSQALSVAMPESSSAITISGVEPLKTEPLQNGGIYNIIDLRNKAHGRGAEYGKYKKKKDRANSIDRRAVRAGSSVDRCAHRLRA
ncbi:MAG: hypothetical protein IJM24_06010, partial [Clostridia bacterium]|nr:hypothetical protein [Clostridia bacterium]